MSESDAPAADWYPDPSGRFQFRYWDGEAWTGHVSTDGKTDWDPPGDGDAEQADDAAASDAGADDSAWAPAADDAEPAAEVSAEDDGATPVEQVAADSTPAEAAADDQATIGEDEPSDTNLVANRRAGIAEDVEAWLDEVAGQVAPRLSRISPEWTAQPQAEAARACAYGLLVGHLARLHPHMKPELGQVAEAHPSFTTLQAGARLETLEQIAADPERAAAWLGPLIGTEDTDRVKTLFD